MGAGSRRPARSALQASINQIRHDTGCSCSQQPAGADLITRSVQVLSQHQSFLTWPGLYQAARATQALLHQQMLLVLNLHADVLTRLPAFCLRTSAMMHRRLLVSDCVSDPSAVLSLNLEAFVPLQSNSMW